MKLIKNSGCYCSIKLDTVTAASYKEETKMDFTVFTEKGEFTFEEEREGIKKNTLESYEKSLNKKEGEQ